jgi:hypothetical protein
MWSGFRLNANIEGMVSSNPESDEEDDRIAEKTDSFQGEVRLDLDRSPKVRLIPPHELADGEVVVIIHFCPPSSTRRQMGLPWRIPMR